METEELFQAIKRLEHQLSQVLAQNAELAQTIKKKDEIIQRLTEKIEKLIYANNEKDKNTVYMQRHKTISDQDIDHTSSDSMVLVNDELPANDKPPTTKKGRKRRNKSQKMQEQHPEKIRAYRNNKFSLLESSEDETPCENSEIQMETTAIIHSFEDGNKSQANTQNTNNDTNYS